MSNGKEITGLRFISHLEQYYVYKTTVAVDSLQSTMKYKRFYPGNGHRAKSGKKELRGHAAVTRGAWGSVIQC